MRKKNQSTEQLAIDDDVYVPPPRVAKSWVCLKCGNHGAAPEPGIALIDPRYAIGYCECTPGRRNKVSGYKREKTNLVADYAFDPVEWQARRDHKAEKTAYERQRAGLPMSPEENRLAMRFRVRHGLPAE